MPVFGQESYNMYEFVQEYSSNRNFKAYWVHIEHHSIESKYSVHTDTQQTTMAIEPMFLISSKRMNPNHITINIIRITRIIINQRPKIMPITTTRTHTMSSMMPVQCRWLSQSQHPHRPYISQRPSRQQPSILLMIICLHCHWNNENPFRLVQHMWWAPNQHKSLTTITIIAVTISLPLIITPYFIKLSESTTI